MKRHVFGIAAACGLTAVLAASAGAQQVEGTGPRQGGATGVRPGDADAALADRALAELKRRRFDRAAPLFAQLRAKYPDSREYQAYHALCLYETGRLDQARAIYETILDEQPENVLALLALARIHARDALAEKDQDARADLEESARECLRRAAAGGANCLRAIRTYPELEGFRRDYALQIQLIHEPQHAVGGTTRDVFKTALTRRIAPSTGCGGPPLEKFDRKAKRALVDNIESLLASLDEKIARSDFEGLGRAWLEIADVIDQTKDFGFGDTDLLARLADLKRKYRAGLGMKSLLLKGFYAQGERMVTDMLAAFDARDPAKIMELWAALENHAKRMKQTDEQYGKAADDLLARGGEVYARGKVLAEIRALRLEVTGILAGASAGKAIVNNRIVAENDLVRDQRGAPIAELRVASIKKKRVRFEYKGLEFEEKIRSQP